MTGKSGSDARNVQASHSRILLGTVQLGVPYGRRRNEGAPDQRLVRSVFEEAWARGIRAFDTSDNYGDAAARLAEWLLGSGRMGDAHVVTKVPVGESERDELVKKACDRFAGAASIMVLTHGSVLPATFARFSSICHGLGVMAGQSVYTASEVTQAGLSGAARVQAPVNVLDERQLLGARESGIALDARSVYLQGVLLDDPAVAEVRVPAMGEFVAEVRKQAEKCGLPVAEALLAGVMRLIGPADRVVLGVDSPDQLDVIPRALEAPSDAVTQFIDAMSHLRSRLLLKPALLDPRNWTT
jgi:aryl-alcohol dehydrogenase-like predicted oxidoreductase